MATVIVNTAATSAVGGSMLDALAVLGPVVLDMLHSVAGHEPFPAAIELFAKFPDPTLAYSPALRLFADMSRRQRHLRLTRTHAPGVQMARPFLGRGCVLGNHL